MKYIISILFLLSMVSCSDFLEEEVYTSANPDKFYSNEQQVSAALSAAYSNFQVPNYYDHQIFQMVDLTTEMLKSRWNNNVYNDYTKDKSDNAHKLMWEAVWKANNAINAVINNSEAAVMNEDLKERMIAEAKFLRGLNYFNMIRLYRRVPLVLNFITDMEGDIYPQTTTLDLVYDQIITDLTDAEDVLPWTYSTGDIGRATKGATKALLGKVYLTYAGSRIDTTSGSILEQGDPQYYQKATDKLKEVIDANIYDLFDDYIDNFRNETENGIEHIFSIQYKQGALGPGGWGGEGSSKQTRWAPKAMITHTSWESYHPWTSFYHSFGVNDKRRDAIFLTHYLDGYNVEQSYPETLNQPYIKKYIRDIHEGDDNNYSTASATDGEENTIVLRYADVLLMYSEALMEATQDVNDEVLVGINKVRERAGLTKYTTVNFGSLGAFRNAIINEREWELCYEGHGWFDYTRMGLLEDKVAKASKVFYSFPVPSLEIAKNPNLLQSPGW